MTVESKSSFVRHWDIDPGLLLCTTRRHGGVSSPPFDSLNMSFPSDGEDPDDAVRENRKRVASMLKIPPIRLTCGQQVHGTRIHRVNAKDVGRGAFSRADAFEGTDGLVTDVPSIPLMAFGADCPVVVILTPKTHLTNRGLGVAHAGWRGALAGIAPKLAREVVDVTGQKAENLTAFIAPSIGPCCYEVGGEVLTQGRSSDPNFDDHVRTKGGRTHLDLWGLLRAQLTRTGIPSNSIQTAAVCSRCQSDQFFSYRAAGQKTGACATIAMLRP